MQGLSRGGFFSDLRWIQEGLEADPLEEVVNIYGSLVLLNLLLAMEVVNLMEVEVMVVLYLVMAYPNKKQREFEKIHEDEKEVFDIWEGSRSSNGWDSMESLMHGKPTSHDASLRDKWGMEYESHDTMDCTRGRTPTHVAEVNEPDRRL